MKIEAIRLSCSIATVFDKGPLCLVEVGTVYTCPDGCTPTVTRITVHRGDFPPHDDFYRIWGDGPERVLADVDARHVVVADYVREEQE